MTDFLVGFELPQALQLLPDPRWAYLADLKPAKPQIIENKPPVPREPVEGRRPQDPKKVWARREEYNRRYYAFKKHGIFSKMFKCTFEWAGCGSCGKNHINPIKCMSRLCPFDENRRSAERVSFYEWQAKRALKPTFLTLTRPRVPYGSLLKGIKQTKKALTLLFRRTVFENVLGGVYSLEVVPHPDGWHLHAHLLLDGWIENRNEHGRPLEKAWKGCLETAKVEFPEGKRAVVHILPCTPQKMREVLKYTVKGASSSSAESSEADPGSSSPPQGGATSVHTGSKIGDSRRVLEWGEIPFEGLKELVDVLEGRVHMMEPLKGWRGTLGEFRDVEEERLQGRPWDRFFCECGGELTVLARGLRWVDPYLKFINGQITCMPPPEFREPNPDMLASKAEKDGRWLGGIMRGRKKAE
jgi:hypothetical protein